MNMEYWLKQTRDKPLFPDLIWGRPENKQTAGKLLIIGGNAHGFAAPAEAYAEALKVGVGTARVLMPYATKKIVGSILENVEFAPSTPSGSLARQALGELLEQSKWADGVLLAGDLGHNSETAMLLETYLSKSSEPVTLTKDAVDYAVNIPEVMLERPHTLLVLNISQLQKLYKQARLPVAITFSMDLLKLVEALHNLTNQHKIAVIVRHMDYFVVSYGGQVSTTPATIKGIDVWQVKTAAHAAVWWLQNSQKPFETITTSIVFS